MEVIDWLNLTTGGLAIAIFIGSLLIMFTNILDLRKKISKT